MLLSCIDVPFTPEEISTHPLTVDDDEIPGCSILLEASFSLVPWGP